MGLEPNATKWKCFEILLKLTWKYCSGMKYEDPKHSSFRLDSIGVQNLIYHFFLMAFKGIGWNLDR